MEPILAKARQTNLLLHSQRKSTAKRTGSFLALPGELRNLVYHYYFQDEYRCEIAGKGTKFEKTQPKVIKLCLPGLIENSPINAYREALKPEGPAIIHTSRRLGHYKRAGGIQTSWLYSLCGIVLVCKQVHCETLIFLYSKTTFAFAAATRIKNFVEILPKKNLSRVTRLHLHYITYGDPQASEDRIWQEKHLWSWKGACKAASKTLVNLKELQVYLKVNTSPLTFDLRQRWLEPLLQFRRLSCAGKSKAAKDVAVITSGEPKPSTPLRVVKIHFKTYWSGPHALIRHADPVLVDANTDLHHIFARAISRAILGANEEKAMAEFKEAWECKYQRWHHHLAFSYTGW